MCHCSIIPPHILEALARRGSVFCKRTLNDTRRILYKREMALDFLLLRPSTEANGQRLVYDCNQAYQQRLELARKEGDPDHPDPVVNKAYKLSGFVRKYFREELGLDSIDGQGMPVISNVHFGKAYNNAYWDGDEMTYGDGDGIEFRNFAGAIDVVAHELTHGVTQFLGNLEYYGQPGALNEHFSDVFGTLIKQRYYGQEPTEGDWLIGDEVVAPGFPGKAIRSLREPGSANDYDRQPAHMKNYYMGEEDRQGVHINSGIPNRAFYLCCMELGHELSAQVWFQALSQLWRTSNFQDLLYVLNGIASGMADKGEGRTDLAEVIQYSFAEVGIMEVVA